MKILWRKGNFELFILLPLASKQFCGSSNSRFQNASFWLVLSISSDSPNAALWLVLSISSSSFSLYAAPWLALSISFGYQDVFSTCIDAVLREQQLPLPKCVSEGIIFRTNNLPYVTSVTSNGLFCIKEVNYEVRLVWITCSAPDMIYNRLFSMNWDEWNTLRCWSS